MDLTVLTDEELDALRVAVHAERENRILVQTAPAQIAAITALYVQASENAPAAPIDQIPDGQPVGPGRKYVDSTGGEWRNVSGSWLDPRISGPLIFSAGWKLSKVKAPKGPAA